MKQFIAFIIVYTTLFTITCMNTSCKTVYVKADLPEYHYKQVEKPKNITDDADGVDKLMVYSMKLQDSLNDFQDYYDELRVVK